MALRLFLHWGRARTEGSSNPSSERRGGACAHYAESREIEDKRSSVSPPPLLNRTSRKICPVFVSGTHHIHLFIYNTIGALLNSRVLKKIPVNRGGQESGLRSLLIVNEEATFEIWSKGIRKMREQRVADCGGNFVPNKKASPQASERRACEGGSLKSKNA